jgi:hypothetical protein
VVRPAARARPSSGGLCGDVRGARDVWWQPSPSQPVPASCESTLNSTSLVSSRRLHRFSFTIRSMVLACTNSSTDPPPSLPFHGSTPSQSPPSCPFSLFRNHTLFRF